MRRNVSAGRGRERSTPSTRAPRHGCSGVMVRGAAEIAMCASLAGFYSSRRPSAARGPEGVALSYLARVQSRAEPAHALLRGAVGEGFGRHVAARLLLEAVVADGGGSLEPGLDIARIEEVPPLGVEAPHAGEAVGLELHRHRERVAAAPARARALRRDLLGDADEVLHVMADLVGDHVGARELTRRPEALGQLLEERAVEIDALVPRAVERPDRVVVLAARGLDGAAEEDEARRLVLAALLLEDGAPCVLGVAQHARHEVLGRVGRSGRAAARRRGRCGTVHRWGAAALNPREDLQRIEPEEEAHDHHRDEPRAPELHAAAQTTSGPPLALPVLDVAATPP